MPQALDFIESRGFVHGQLSEEARQIAWKAQQRLHKRFAALTARGKESNVAATAIARELLGFMWAIAVLTEAQQKQAKAA